MIAVGAGEDADMPVWLVDGHEEGITLDVVPVTVRQQDIYRAILFDQAFAEISDTGAGIQHKVLTVGCFYVNAGSVATISAGISTRGGNRSTHPVKCYFHYQPAPDD